MSAQVKRQFGLGCLLTLQDNKVILTNSSHQHIVFALSDLEALVGLWSKHKIAMMESVRAAELVHLRMVLSWDKPGTVNTVCGIKTRISNESVHWTKRVRNCTCPKCKKNLAAAKEHKDESSATDSEME